MLLILRSGILSLEVGANGGFFSVGPAFGTAVDTSGGAETAARALLSCFSLVFLSSASCPSRSRIWFII